MGLSRKKEKASGEEVVFSWIKKKEKLKNRWRDSSHYLMLCSLLLPLTIKITSVVYKIHIIDYGSIF